MEAAKSAMTSALRGAEQDVIGEALVYGNPTGLSALRQLQGLRADLDAQNARINAQDARINSQAEQIAAMSRSCESYCNVRLRFLSTWKRDIMGSTVTGDSRYIFSKAMMPLMAEMR